MSKHPKSTKKSVSVAQIGSTINSLDRLGTCLVGLHLGIQRLEESMSTIEQIGWAKVDEDVYEQLLDGCRLITGGVKESIDHINQLTPAVAKDLVELRGVPHIAALERDLYRLNRWPGWETGPIVGFRIPTSLEQLDAIPDDAIFPPRAEWDARKKQVHHFLDDVLAVTRKCRRSNQSEGRVAPESVDDDQAAIAKIAKKYKAKILKGERLAVLSYEYAESDAGKTIKDEYAYEWLKEHVAEDDLPEAFDALDGYALPAEKATWLIYLSKGRTKLGKNKNQRRDGRESPSVVPQNKL